MTFLEGYKDNSGFHYRVRLDGPDGKVREKLFNYGPPAGLIYVELGVSYEESPTGQKTIPVPETDDDYQKRIEAEIESTARQIEQAWQSDPETGGLSADIKTDLLKKNKSASRL